MNQSQNQTPTEGTTDRITGTVCAVTAPSGNSAIRRWDVVITTDDGEVITRQAIRRFNVGDLVETFLQDPYCYILDESGEADPARSGFDDFLHQAVRDSVHGVPQARAAAAYASNSTPKPPDPHALMMNALRRATSEEQMREVLTDTVDDAVDEAVRHIQDILGEPDGGFAATHFDGEEGEILRGVLMRYAVAQWCETGHRYSTPPGEMATIRMLVEALDALGIDDTDMPSFVSDSGTRIVDPTLDESHQTEVDPILYYGPVVRDWATLARQIVDSNRDELSQRLARVDEVLFGRGGR